MIQKTALDAIAQIWWDVSDHDPEVKKQLQGMEGRYLEFLVLRPQMDQMLLAETQEYLLRYREALLKHRNAWFEMKKLL